jgi:hypothetical protein
MDDIVALIKQWRQSGEEVILCRDANQDVYRGQLATLLSSPDILLSFMIENATGTKVLNSHFKGTAKITMIFGSP